MVNGKKVIFWDWNGTLLDDVEICIEAMNKLLLRRKMPLLDEKRYKEVFTFPVKHYYNKLGFDFESEAFEIPALEFIDEYKQLLSRALLFEDAAEVLKKLSAMNFRQFIVSAMENNALNESVKSRQIANYFEHVIGISDDYAFGKLDLYHHILKQYNIDSAKALMIGDTLHDYEIAKALNIDVMLIGRGHQSKLRLGKTGLPVYDSFLSITKELNPEKTGKSEC